MLLPWQNYSVDLYGFQQEVQIGLHSKFLPTSLSSISLLPSLAPAKLCNLGSHAGNPSPCCTPNQGIPQQILNIDFDLSYYFIQELSPLLIG